VSWENILENDFGFYGQDLFTVIVPKTAGKIRIKFTNDVTRTPLTMHWTTTNGEQAELPLDLVPGNDKWSSKNFNPYF